MQCIKDEPKRNSSWPVSQPHWACVALVASLLGVPQGALATNGMNMIGFNARSTGLAGADAALEYDCPACNPATLGSEDARSLSAGLALLHPPVNFRNGLYGPNDVDSDDNIYFAPYLDYAHRLQDSGWTLGVTARAQGGMGVEFEPVLSPTGASDRLYTDLKFANVMPAVSYRVNERMRLGAALIVGYTQMDSDLFPESYAPGPDGIPATPDDFVGLRIRDVSGTGYGGRFGLHYQVSERVGLGLTYQTETGIDMDGGRLTLNLGAARVGYAARLDGFALPAEAQFGLSVMVTPALRLAVEAHWIDWHSALGTITVKGTDPDVPLPLPDPELEFRLNWDAQWVFALGWEFNLSDRHQLRAGWNYGKNPVPNENLVPLFPGHVEHHLTLGYGIELEKLTLDFAWEHSFENTEGNTNPDPRENPFGPDSRVTVNPGNALHVALTYRF